VPSISSQFRTLNIVWTVANVSIQHVICVEKDKQNGALVFYDRTAGTETITVWLGFEQAQGSVKTQVKLNIH
jgi:hypothetical protein